MFHLLFCPDRLVEQGRQHRPDAPIRHLRRNILLVRKNVRRAFSYAVFLTIFLIITFVVINFAHFSIPRKIPIIFRLMAYFLVLWGLLSPTYLGIKPIPGEFAEIANEEWHRGVYGIGLLLLLLSYLFELIEPVDMTKIDFSIFLTGFEYLKSQLFSKYIIGYGVSVVGGHIFINPINGWMRDERNRRQPGRKKVDNGGLLSWLVGITERVAFTTALIADYPKFVALWLTLKFAGRWKEWRPEKPGGWGRVNIFLVGNMLSILFSFIGAAIIRPNLFFK
jgi:hypothetical protein